MALTETQRRSIIDALAKAKTEIQEATSLPLARLELGNEMGRDVIAWSLPDDGRPFDADAAEQVLNRRLTGIITNPLSGASVTADRIEPRNYLRFWFFECTSDTQPSFSESCRNAASAFSQHIEKCRNALAELASASNVQRFETMSGFQLIPGVHFDTLNPDFQRREKVRAFIENEIQIYEGLTGELTSDDLKAAVGKTFTGNIADYLVVRKSGLLHNERAGTLKTNASLIMEGNADNRLLGRWPGNRPLDISGAVFEKLLFGGKYFSKANLRHAFFRHTTFLQCNFDGAVADHADFSHSHIHLADFKGAKFRRANFSQCDMTCLWVNNATDFTGADFTGCSLNEAAVAYYPRDGFAAVMARLTKAQRDQIASGGGTKAGGNQTNETTPAKSGCFIATACYGSHDAPEVRVLRRFRDESLLASPHGRWLVKRYYQASPLVAAWLGRHPALANKIRELLLNPLTVLIQKSRR